MEDLEIFSSSDQPTNCPHCGNRTEMIDTSIRSQLHTCFSKECNFQFILEFDNETEV